MVAFVVSVKKHKLRREFEKEKSPCKYVWKREKKVPPMGGWENWG